MRETLGVAGSLAAAFRVLGVGAESLGSAMGVGAGTLGSATSAAAVGTAGKATCLGTTSCGATVAGETGSEVEGPPSGSGTRVWAAASAGESRPGSSKVSSSRMLSSLSCR